jgi:hypothetical protein
MVGVAEKAAQDGRTEAEYAIHFASVELAKTTRGMPTYADGRETVNSALIKLAQGKWFHAKALGMGFGVIPHTGDPDDLERARQCFLGAKELADRAKDSIVAGESGFAVKPETVAQLSTNGAEINFADGVPLIPTVCPVVILEGSSYEMGRQYVRQLSDIYGRWIFEAIGSRSFSPEELVELRRWEGEIIRYTPEIIDMVRGWADEASALGVPTSYDQALVVWTRCEAPKFETSFYHVQSASLDQSPRSDEVVDPKAAGPCSGVAAWGACTKSGELVVGATQDHDCTFMVTIVAFPEEGNSFIYTPFSAVGGIPFMGAWFMAGHPGTNSKGVTYVHHGGAQGGEPKEQWGYGLRRGAGTLHVLRYANSAREAREMELSWPVGDSGLSVQGTPHGFWADAEGAFVLEARPGSPDAPQPIERTRSIDSQGDEYDFLYATNNAISPLSGHMNAPPPGGYKYSPEGGWYTFDPAEISSGTPAEQGRRYTTKNSEGRNRFLFRKLQSAYGQVDADYLEQMWREGGEIPPGPVNEVYRRYDQGEQWNVSAANRGNAFVSVVVPATANRRAIYKTCIGPAKADLATCNARHGYYYFDETEEFLELTLAESAEDVCKEAKTCAERHMAAAEAIIPGKEGRYDEYLLTEWWEQTQSHFSEGLKGLSNAAGAASRDEALREVSRATRCFNRAQVRAQQVAHGLRAREGTLVASRVAPDEDSV